MTIRLIGQLLVQDGSARSRDHLLADTRSTHSSTGVGDEVGMSLLQQSLSSEACRGVIARLTTRFGVKRRIKRHAFD